MSAPAEGAPAATLAERVAALDWYHTLELAPGVVTPGWFDLREVAARLPMPPSLEGRRCLDVGTFDGFWGFEMERRGAASVTAIDVLDPAGWDWPASFEEVTVSEIGRRKARGHGFEIAAEALGSRVERIERSVYDLDPAVDGHFDFVYVGSLLLHLRDPVGALERARSVCSGQLLAVDAIEPSLRTRRPVATLDGIGRPWWWKPNPAGFARMVEAAGLDIVEGPIPVRLPAGAGHPRPSWREGFRSHAGRDLLRTSRRGDPHAAVLARPGV